MSIYIFLWLLEGALRKWVPETASVLYVARDLIFAASVLILMLGRSSRSGTARWFWPASLSILALAVVQIFLGIVSPTVAALGARSYLAPALFVAAVAVWGRPSTLRVVQRAVLIAVPFELALSMLQAFSPARSWVNAQVGSDEASFVNFGVVRPSGTFSAPAGLLTFVPLALAFTLEKFSARTGKSTVLATVLTAATFLIVALSGARGVVLGVAVVVAAYAACAVAGWGRPKRLPLAPLLTLILVSGVAASVLFSSILSSFAQRFNDASRSENPLARLLNQAVGFVDSPLTLLGTGPGSRSQVGIAAGSAFGWLEIDNDRWVAELGLLGFVLALVRVVAFVWLVVLTVRRIGDGQWLFALISASFLPTLFSGSLTQTPSAQAGAAVTIGLLLLCERYRAPRVRGSVLRPQSAQQHAFSG
ncbi:hypothetical protein [Curtobacterium sp. ER1/6]|uniref:hypothetical protein n=1 Tax=Curtobacterium sp. ER1/6 TaxID=1891920 RepID=UPI00166FFD71|nr:hypothetical protein [Curtobacterium sp. ER1/6]